MVGPAATDLRGHIPGCDSGLASFNAEATEAGLRVVSCNPLHRFSAAQDRLGARETTGP